MFNYLFARHHGGDFLLRIEDTDQGRYVEGAEQYILDCLDWCGLNPDEGPQAGGNFGPYRQSERKESYRRYAEQLVHAGFAYYAFDTPEELDTQRRDNPNFRYGLENRNHLYNSLTLTKEKVNRMLDDEVPHVIRIKMPADEVVSFKDMIRGEVSFETNLVDDKVLLKADGMPTYHLAVVVDDYLMKISHAFRGEEWLPSAPVHVLLWEYFGWKEDMPEWAHLPLILKPDGHGKLSKRDGDRLGFPVFAMNWQDTRSNQLIPGFKELGFLPEAFINLLALLGWNDGTEQEIFTLNELVQKFSIERVSRSGAKFDFEKAKWFNAEWIKRSEAVDLKSEVKKIFTAKGVAVSDDNYLEQVISLVKERCILLTDFFEQASFFFTAPEAYDLEAVKPKWTDVKTEFFRSFAVILGASSSLNTGAAEKPDAADLEQKFKALAEENGLKVGEVMLPFRIMLVGGKFGPQVFEIAAVLGREETIRRIQNALKEFNL